MAIQDKVLVIKEIPEKLAPQEAKSGVFFNLINSFISGLPTRD